MQQNLINLTEQELDTPVYRIYSFKYLIEMLKSNKNVLVKTSKWEDPFENFILNATGVVKQTKQKFTIGNRDCYYGQCWSLKRESDAMWRIYSNHLNNTGNLVYDNVGIKVKSTIRKIFTPLFESSGKIYNPLKDYHYSLYAFVGKVSYMSVEKLKEKLINPERYIYDQSGRGQAETLMFKRIPFSHEKEVRLIINILNSSADIIYEYLIDSNSCFDEIVVDPRISEEDFLKIKTEILNAGFSNKIIQSGLYKLRNLTFEANLPGVI